MFIGLRRQQRKNLLQMQFKLRCNVAISTLFVMHQKLQMQQLLIELNTGLQILIWFRVFTLYSQLGFFCPFIFWTTQFLNFDPLICYGEPFFFIGFFSNFSSTHFCKSFINIIFSSSHICLMGIIIYVFFVIIFLILKM